MADLGHEPPVDPPDGGPYAGIREQAAKARMHAAEGRHYAERAEDERADPDEWPKFAAISTAHSLAAIATILAGSAISTEAID